MMQKNVLLILSLGIVFTTLMSCGGCGISVGMDAKYTEPLDWAFDGTGVSIIDAQTSNGAISFDGSTQNQVIVHAWKEVRAPNEEDAKEFARQVQVHAERNGNVIRIYKEHPKRPKGINVAVRYEIQSPSAVSLNFRTSNGKIQLNRVDGTVDADTD